MRGIQQLAFLLLLLAGSCCFAQTGVKVTYYDGTVQVFNVATTGKLYFATDNLLIKLTETATPTTIPVSIIRKINLTDSLAQSPLPVSLTLFKATAGDCAATVNWESGSEENFSYYELQYGNSNASFANSLKVFGTGSNSNYRISLQDLNGKVYYRLKMVDKDGAAKYSVVLSNQVACLSSNYALYPNPVSDVLKVVSGDAVPLNIKIFTSVGQLVRQGVYQSGQGIDVAGLASGLYLVQVNGVTLKFTKK